jgi:hypothetical protein
MRFIGISIYIFCNFIPNDPTKTIGIGSNPRDDTSAYSGSVDTSFLPACVRHDTCYMECGQTQTQCDNEFRNRLINICQPLQGHPSDPQGIYYNHCMSWADTYYDAVVSNGAKSFEAAQAEYCPCPDNANDQFTLSQSLTSASSPNTAGLRRASGVHHYFIYNL